MARNPQLTRLLLVEGKNDLHVISHLCQKHQVQETFRIEYPAEEGATAGVKAVLESLPIRLKPSPAGLQTLGIVVDADDKLNNHWQSACKHLEYAGYHDLPSLPPREGFITEDIPANKPKVGIWLMPDNQSRGMLEDFVAYLIPQGDILATKAETCLQEIECEKLNRYKQAHHCKAFIHTWLAWQDPPGNPMGTAITAHSLNHNAELARVFVQWLNRLFNG